MKKIRISDHFGIFTIFTFALPAIGMQMVNNTYQVADGYFISNYIGPSAFAAENLIFPPLVVVAGIGMMFGSGAAAQISHSLGEEDVEKANGQLSMMIGILAGLSILVSAVMFLIFPWIARVVGATEDLIPQCVKYGRILAVCMPFMMLNAAFRPLLITADRSDIGLAVSITNAVINIVLDWIAVAVLGWGLTGAALATGLAWAISFMIPLFWFMNRKSPLHFGPFRIRWRELGRTCYNGGSEMTTAVSYALIAMLYNGQLMRYAGEAGVDAYAVSAYVNGVYMAVFFGIAMSINPVVGYHLGQGNTEELRSIRRNGLILMSVLGIFMAVISFIFAGQFARFFVGYDQGLTELAVRALRIICLAYVFGGITTFFSSYFTGMGDGTDSLAVAVTKSFAIPLAGLMILPVFLGTTGIWIVSPIGEMAAFGVVLFVFVKYKKKRIL